MYNCGMRQLEEKHVAYQVDLMVWSNRLDLLALSNFKGEVQVHRLNWQKVWTLPPSKENDLVQAMAWRPDGKALAIGYSSGCVCIVDIEDKDILDKFHLEMEPSEVFKEQTTNGVTTITWSVRAGALDNASEYNLYEDASIFLQKPPSLSSYKNQGNDDNAKDFKEIQEQTQFNLLMIGYGTGFIHMSVFGRFPFGTISLANVVNDDYGIFRVLDTNISDDFSVMQVMYSDSTSNRVFAAVINTSVLSAFAEEVFSVANKHVQIVQLLSYLDQTMLSIHEAWEHILIEMDKKMADYAASVPEGGVSADFLELLMLGIASDELELFLLQELTAKGLKKFGTSVELSYSTIQKLVLRQLNIVGQSLTYYLSELKGLTKIPDRYKIVGLDETKVSEAIKACFAFLNKCLELQQVIDVSMRNYKAFFRWLFVIIVRLLEEHTPAEIVKITQQELTHIAEFLYNFDNIKSDPATSVDRPVRFNLERLGQYLQNQDLPILPDDEDNPWHKFLKDNACLVKDSDTIFSVAEFKKFSLVQQQQYLKDKIKDVFDVAEKDIGQHFSIVHNFTCYENRGVKSCVENLRYSQMFDATEHRFMLALIDKSNETDGIHFVSVNVKEEGNGNAVKYYFSNRLLPNGADIADGEIAILDLQFYSSEYLSVLVKHPQNDDSCIFVQLPLKTAINNAKEFKIKWNVCVFNDQISRTDISPLLDQEVFKMLEKMDGFRIAVSGGRKVSVVLSKSQRKVRVFEMEVDGEDDEDDTLDTTPVSQNTTLKSDNVSDNPLNITDPTT